MKTLLKALPVVVAVVGLGVASQIWAGGAGHTHGPSIGAPGKAADVSRTIEVAMYDNYYEPERITVKPGETIKFVVVNKGEFVHEFNIGNAEGHVAHQEEMMTMMEHGMMTPTSINHEMMNMDHSQMGMADMKHDDPNSVLMEPGETAELIWQFGATAGLEFACNVPGHYDSGMVGDIRLGTGSGS